METNFKTKKKICFSCEKNEVLKNRKYCVKCLYQIERLKQIEKNKKKKEREAMRKLKRKEKRENNTRLLKKKLDSVFSVWIRKKSIIPNSYGKIKCVCCGKLVQWNKAQNMHYVSRSNYSLRYDERNCKAGCMRCNVFLHGNYPAYTEYLLNTYGEEWLRKLIADGRQTRQWQPSELKELIALYSVDN